MRLDQSPKPRRQRGSGRIVVVAAIVLALIVLPAVGVVAVGLLQNVTEQLDRVINGDGNGEAFTPQLTLSEVGAWQGTERMNILLLGIDQRPDEDPDKTRTDIAANRGVFNHSKNVLDLYEEITVVSESGLKAMLTRATLLTKESLLTSPEPVVVEFPNGSIRSKQMTLRQKAREATFSEDVIVELTPPPEKAPSDPAAAPAKAGGADPAKADGAASSAEARK